MRLTEKLFLGRWFPVLLLLVMICTWAIQIPYVGYYLDDWIFLTGYHQGGFQGLLDYSIDDSRPVSLALVYYPVFKLIGTGKLAWQIYVLFWRFLAGIVSWALIRRVWPQRKDIAAISAILFAIFPFFKHQAFPIAYYQVWMQSPVILTSFLLTVMAIQTDSRRKKVFFHTLACLLSAFQLMVTEYYLTLELARLCLIWFVSQPVEKGRREKIRAVISTWLPYLLVFIAYCLYRFFVMPALINDRNEIELLSENPGFFQLLLHLAQMLVQYATESIWGVWYRSIDPANFDLAKLNTKAALGMAAAVMGLLLLILFRLRKRQELFREGSDAQQILLFAVIATVLGFFPGMAIDKNPSSTALYHDRFLIPSFWGISLGVTAFAVSCLNRRVLKAAVVVLACGISVFFQIQNSANYRYAWENQQNFQWQLKWRAPDLKENTAVLGDAIIASFMGGWADGAMVFEMYGKQTGHKPTTYWYFNMGGRDYWKEIWEQLPFEYNRKIYETNIAPQDVVVVTKSEWDRCLWLLDEADMKNPYLPAYMRDLIPHQNKDRIDFDSDYQMPPEVFGTDYRHDWCYYYEQGAAGVDRRDYSAVLDLYEEAAAQGYSMKKPVEMTPFIRAAAATGDWDLAAELTIVGGSLEPHITWEYFSNLWELLYRDTDDSPERAEAFESIQDVIRLPGGG